MKGKVCNESKVQSQAARGGLVYGGYDVLLNVPGWGVCGGSAARCRWYVYRGAGQRKRHTGCTTN